MKCEYCGKNFVNQRSTARFCSSKCRVYAYRTGGSAVKRPGSIAEQPSPWVSVTTEPASEVSVTDDRGHQSGKWTIEKVIEWWPFYDLTGLLVRLQDAAREVLKYPDDKAAKREFNRALNEAVVATWDFHGDLEEIENACLCEEDDDED
jgi:hypothetical protein